MKNILLLSGILVVFCLSNLSAQKKNKGETKPFMESFGQEKCTFSTTGKNDFFILEPGYTLVLEEKDGKDTTVLVITVLNETKKVGDVETRIIEEKETVNGINEEISRNYFAFCAPGKEGRRNEFSHLLCTTKLLIQF